MWTIIITMGVIVVLAGLVVLYVAFPHRGEEVPAAPWLGDAMSRAVEAAPTIENTAETSDAVMDLEGAEAPEAPEAEAAEAPKTAGSPQHRA
jgi:hypothetical protein